MFKFFFSRKDPPNYNHFIDPSKEEKYEGLEPFIFEHDIDSKKPTSEQILDCYNFFISDAREKNTDIKPDKYIKLRREFYLTFPSPESVVKSFDANIYHNFPKLILKCLEKAPYSWIDRFIRAGGHNSIFNFLQSSLKKHQMTFITFRDQDYIIISELLQILCFFTEDVKYSGTIYKNNAKWPSQDIFFLIISMYNPIDIIFDMYCLKLLHSMIVSIPSLGKNALIIKAIEKKEKKSGISDIFRLFKILTYDKSSIYADALFDFIVALITSVSYEPSFLLYIGHRLIYADFSLTIKILINEIDQHLDNSSEKWTNLNGILLYILEFINTSKDQYLSLIGTPYCDPRKPERLIDGLLSNEEIELFKHQREVLTHMFTRKSDITIETEAFLISDNKKNSKLLTNRSSGLFNVPELYDSYDGQVSSNYEMLHRLLLELVCILGKNASIHLDAIKSSYLFFNDMNNSNKEIENDDKKQSKDEEKLEKKKASMEYILNVMKIARFLMICCPSMHIVELLQRSAFLVNFMLSKNITTEILSQFKSKFAENDSNLNSSLNILFDINPGLSVSKNWKKECGFFSGDDFFSNFILKLIILITKHIDVFHSKDSPLDAQNCQTMIIMLKSSTEKLRNNFDLYYKCMAKSSIFDEFAINYMNSSQSRNDLYNQILKELSENEKADYNKNKFVENKGASESFKKIKQEDSFLASAQISSELPAIQKAIQPSAILSVQSHQNQIENLTSVLSTLDGVEPSPSPPLPPPPPPPPPPPCSGSILKKPNIAPQVRMKRFFWEKIPDRESQSTIWNEIDDSAINLKDNGLVDLFREAGRSFVNQNTQNDAANLPKKDEKVYITLLTSSRQKSFDIMLARIKIDPEIFIKRVREIDLSFTKEEFEMLYSNIPKQEEIENIKIFKGNIEQLTKSDNYVRLISEFPYQVYKDSLEIIKLSTEEIKNIGDSIKDLKLFQKTIDQINASVSFRKILIVILRIGNVINGGGRYGGAYGFKLADLSKLNDARAAIPGETFMSYLIKYLMKYYPETMNIAEELSDVPFALKIDLQNIKSQLIPLKGKIEMINLTALKDDASMKVSDAFKTAAAKLKETIGPEIDEGSELLTLCLGNFTKLLYKFGEDSTTSINDFFNYIVGFLKSFENKRKEIEERERKEKAKKMASMNKIDSRPQLDLDDLKRNILNRMLKKVPS